MSWVRRALGRTSDDALSEPLNLDGLLAEGLRDRAAAKRAIALLDRERKAIVRAQRTLEKQSKTLTSGTVRGIIRGPGIAELQAQHLTQAMQQANDAGGSLSQSVALDERLAAIDRTRSQLYSYLNRLS
jgi:hypothetical protein